MSNARARIPCILLYLEEKDFEEFSEKSACFDLRPLTFQRRHPVAT